MISKTPEDRTYGVSSAKTPSGHRSRSSQSKTKTNVSKSKQTTRSSSKNPSSSKRLQDKVVKLKKTKVEPLNYDDMKLISISETEISGNLKMLRLPTSSGRLTSIDVVLHYLNSLTPVDDAVKHKYFKLFSDYNEDYLNKVLDLNLTNNKLISDLKETKALKTDLRGQLYDIKNKINENMLKVEEIRKKYRLIKSKLLLRRRINQQLKKLKENNKNIETKRQSFNPSKIIQDLNVLNATLDPNWGLKDKLQALNEKLYSLDQKL